MPDKLADLVCHPAHYEVYPVQPIEITRYLGFTLGNVVKYVLRAPWKGGVEDCAKAREYLRYEREMPQTPLLYFANVSVLAKSQALRHFLHSTPGDKLWENIAHWQDKFLDEFKSYISYLDISFRSVELRTLREKIDKMGCHINELQRVLQLRDTAGQIYGGMSGRPCAQENGKSAFHSHQEE